MNTAPFNLYEPKKAEKGTHLEIVVYRPNLEAQAQKDKHRRDVEWIKKYSEAEKQSMISEAMPSTTQPSRKFS